LIVPYTAIDSEVFKTDQDVDDVFDMLEEMRADENDKKILEDANQDDPGKQ
jgi:hypothetical protein